MHHFLIVICTISYFLNGCHCIQKKNKIVTSIKASDADLNFTELVGKYGYPVEVHEIETEDGYLLDIYRIPYGKKSGTKRPNKYPVILNHGLMGSAENFLVGGPRKALPYLLADHGYDVWLCNARGTWHSRKHKTLDPDKDIKFWKFTWHEIGYYDIPATIDYILEKTQNEKLFYVGHSQGTTVFFVMCSERPEYNNKITLMVGFAPSAILAHAKEPALQSLASSNKYVQTLAEVMNIYELFPNSLVSNRNVRFLGKNLCSEHANTRKLCTDLLLGFAGSTSEQLDPDTISLIASTGSAGCSLYQPLHYAQLVDTGKFIQYDWGRIENRKKYNSIKPPEYNLANVTCPISLMYGNADTIIVPEDVEILAKMLPNVVELHKVPYKKWGHMDFIWAKDVDKYVNKHVLRLLKQFRQ